MRTDAGQLIPMLDQVEARTGQRPAAVLADTGFANGVAVQTSAARAITLYAPPQQSKNGRAPEVARRGDRPAEEAKAIYKEPQPPPNGSTRKRVGIGRSTVSWSVGCPR